MTWRASFRKAGAAHKKSQVPVDEWLKGTGLHIFSEAPFRLGLIGFEVSGMSYSLQIENGIPNDRHIGYLWNDRGELEWRPTNRLIPS